MLLFSTGSLRTFSRHVLYYDQQKKVPLWVQEYLTKESLQVCITVHKTHLVMLQL